MHLRASRTIRPVDLLTVARVPRALLRQWMQLTFDDGVLVDAAGVRRAGVRVEAGTHPRPGTRYVLVTQREVTPPPTKADEQALAKMVRAGVERDTAVRELAARRRAAAQQAGTMEIESTTSALELLAEDPQRFRVRVQDRTSTSVGAVVSFEDVRAGPHPGTVSWDVELDGGVHEPRWLASAIRGGGHVELDMSGPGGSPQVRIDADAAHK